MIHELRIYTIIQGREEVELERFDRHLPKLFDRHNIRCVGSWTTLAGPCGPGFVYAMIYDDLAERERQWAAFYADGDWHQIRASTQGKEECVDRFGIYFLRSNAAWRPVASPGEPDRIGGIHDLILAEVAVGEVAAVNAFLSEVYLPAIERAGGEIMMVSDLITGPSLPGAALMIAWSDAQAHHDGWSRLRADPLLHAARREERSRIGRPSIGAMEIWMLEPTPFNLPTRRLGRRIAASE